jgi:hypothetical protein
MICSDNLSTTTTYLGPSACRSTESRAIDPSHRLHLLLEHHERSLVHSLYKITKEKTITKSNQPTVQFSPPLGNLLINKHSRIVMPCHALSCPAEFSGTYLNPSTIACLSLATPTPRRYLLSPSASAAFTCRIFSASARSAAASRPR